jgi:lysosomal acid lipase/cholesteryl ester hydrolase
LRWLFNWHNHNIANTQKLAAYAHLYSFASVKSVVHWFQIMRNGKFQMYDDDVQQPLSLTRPGVSSYAPARFPTKNIVTPIVLLYGDSDSLVDIKQMLHELPAHTSSIPLHGYEHLDVIWGENVHEDVIPHVVEALRKHCVKPNRLEKEVTMINGLTISIEPSGYTTPAEIDA